MSLENFKGYASVLLVSFTYVDVTIKVTTVYDYSDVPVKEV